MYDNDDYIINQRRRHLLKSSAILAAMFLVGNGPIIHAATIQYNSDKLLHIEIMIYPRNLPSNVKTALTKDLCKILGKYFDTIDDDISIALIEVPPSNWKADVYDSLIKPGWESLIKKPGYSL